MPNVHVTRPGNSAASIQAARISSAFAGRLVACTTAISTRGKDGVWPDRLGPPSLIISFPSVFIRVIRGKTFLLLFSPASLPSLTSVKIVCVFFVVSAVKLKTRQLLSENCRANPPCGGIN
jgi:hypothetical protein